MPFVNAYTQLHTWRTCDHRRPRLGAPVGADFDLSLLRAEVLSEVVQHQHAAMQSCDSTASGPELTSKPKFKITQI